MRVVRAVVVGCLLLGLSGCSNNTGKIVGKWESTGGGLPPGVTKIVMEFAADGKLTLTAFAMGQSQVITGKYSLGSGDTVFFNDLSQTSNGKNKTKETIKINGNELSMQGPNGAVMFKRL